MSDFITVPNLEETVISTTVEAHRLRDDLLELAAHVQTVANPAEAALAANTLTRLQHMTRAVENSRKNVKAPVLGLAARIDAAAKELTSQIDSEAVRIARILGEFQAEEKRVAREAQRLALEEINRIRMEARRAEEEAARRAQAEVNALALKEKQAQSAAKAAQYADHRQLTIEQAQADQAARDREAHAALLQARETAIALAPKAMPGIATREEICFEVTDIRMLYEAAPWLVTLTPNKMALKAALKDLAADEQMPGVRHWREAKAVTR